MRDGTTVTHSGLNFDELTSYLIIPYISLITSYNYLNLITNTVIITKNLVTTHFRYH